ncbi:gp16 family protein [Enterovibrio norvegicus]|uniref:gp16 family protein n=1 Tax=Enterovibrio norvegicus TaxID=188144 RepID=UPI0024B13AB2|nr:regulatory protein GemA [Enterovibrio norvegicus]
MQQRTRIIQLIHVGKRELQLDDDTYRALLKRETGSDSCKAMRIEELDRVLSAMERQGFKRKKSAKPKQTEKRLSPKTQGKPDVISKIRALWITMAKEGIVRDGSETALDAYVRRMTRHQNGEGVDHIAWCDDEQAIRIIEALKQWIKRAKD